MTNLSETPFDLVNDDLYDPFDDEPPFDEPPSSDAMADTPSAVTPNSVGSTPATVSR